MRSHSWYPICKFAIHADRLPGRRTARQGGHPHAAIGFGAIAVARTMGARCGPDVAPGARAGGGRPGRHLASGPTEPDNVVDAIGAPSIRIACAGLPSSHAPA